jgi:hypothetical protein
MEDKKLKQIQVATELEIFNKECKRAGLIMESDKEIFSAFDEFEVDPDAFRDFEDEAYKEEELLQQNLEAEKKIEKIENTIQEKQEK